MPMIIKIYVSVQYYWPSYCAQVLYGAMFENELAAYTHWGWIDIDCFFGDLSDMISHLHHYDIVTYPDGVWYGVNTKCMIWN